MNLNLSEHALNTLVEILIVFINSHTLSLRSILQTKLIPKEENEDFELFQFSDVEHRHVFRYLKFVNSKQILFNKNNIELLLIFRVLKCLFGNYNNLYNELNKQSSINNNINPNVSCDIAKTFALPLLLNRHYRNIICEDYDHHNFNYPTVFVLNHSIQIQYKWKNSQPYYLGNESFFNDVNILNTSDNPKINISTQQLFKELSHYINDYSAKNYLYI